jgi:hypothetical protein
MDIDLGGLWSWTVPLWGLFVLVLILGGVLTAPISITSLHEVLPPLRGGGGGGNKKHST